MVFGACLVFAVALGLGALVRRLALLEAPQDPLPPRPPSRPGLWFLAHRADRRFPFQHMFLRLTPSDPAWLGRRPDLFTKTDADGRFYCTLGAGPRGGKLFLEFNRGFDVSDPVSFEEAVVCGGLVEENARIAALLDAAAAYDQSLDFTAWSRRSGKGYNCNSMICELSRRAGMGMPGFTGHFMLCPGCRRGLPKNAFAPEEPA